MFCIELYQNDKWLPIGVWHTLNNAINYVKSKYDKENFQLKYVDITDSVYNMDSLHLWKTITISPY
jgi:disulfide oxidoreductase YuzD